MWARKRAAGHVLRFAVLLGAAAFWVQLGLAQFTSSVEGTVTDASQAAVPEAQVTLTNQLTQVVHRTTTSEAGFFRILQLPPGAYRLEVRREGFRTWVENDLILEGSQARTVYPVLAVGEQAARVEVTAAVNAIETVNAKVSRSVEESTIATTPMVGRNVYAALISLAPGVTGSGNLFGSGAAFSQDSFQAEPGYQINGSGQRQETNEYEVDGTSVNGNSRDGIANLTPEPDTVQEIRVSANSFSAEKGRNSGALIEVFTKSGTNQWHGTLSEFHTNNDLRARTIFETSIPASRRNEYGFTLGGPIIKNQTFVFGSYFGLNQSTVSTSVVREETPQLRSFVVQNFPNSMAAKFFTLDAPLTPPTAQISTVAQVIQSTPGSYPVSPLFPMDLPAVGTATVTQTVPLPARQWNLRVDQNLRSYRDRLYFSWYRPTTNGLVASTRPTLSYRYPTYNVFGRISWTHTFTPALLNEASFSLVRAGGWEPTAAGEAANLPQASITGISTSFNQAGYYRWQHNNFVWHDGLSWMHGNHQLRFGADVDRQRGYAIAPNLVRPTFQFSSILDFAQDLPFSQSGPTMAIASGDTAQNLYRKLYEVYVGLYAQDDWKLTPRLTLNAGMRWDYFGHWGTGSQAEIPYPLFSPGSGTTAMEQVASGVMQVRGPGYFALNRPNGFAPRIGLAWDVFGNGSTSIRAAYGLFYSRVGNLAFGANGDQTNPPAFGSPFLTVQQAGVKFGYGLGSLGGYYFPPPPGFVFRTNASGGIVGSRVSVGSLTPYPDQPTTADWTFSVQRRIGSNFLAEADYLGSHSYHLYTQTDVNRFAGDLVANSGVLTRLNPNFGPIIYGRTIGKSAANIFSFSLSRRFAHGWSARGIYTVGRALDADSSNDNGVTNGRNILDAYNVNAQWGRADFDHKQRFTLDSVWELPNPFHSGLTKNLLGGWRLSTTTILQSGQPFTVYTTAAYPKGDFNADGFNWDVPNAPSFGNYVSVSRGAFIRGLFPASVFPVPPKGQEGNLGRNTFDGPGLANVNMNVIKTVKIPWFVGHEGANLELRGEIFNLFNRVNLTLPIADMSNGLFGRSTGQSQPRAVQFGLRIAF